VEREPPAPAVSLKQQALQEGDRMVKAVDANHTAELSRVANSGKSKEAFNWKSNDRDHTIFEELAGYAAYHDPWAWSQNKRGKIQFVNKKEKGATTAGLLRAQFSEHLAHVSDLAIFTRLERRLK